LIHINILAYFFQIYIIQINILFESDTVDDLSISLKRISLFIKSIGLENN